MQDCRHQHRLYRARQSLGNGYIESFNARLRDELLDGEIFYSPREAQTVIKSWRRHYNRIRPHAPEVFGPSGLNSRQLARSRAKDRSTDARMGGGAAPICGVGAFYGQSRHQAR